MLAYSKTEQTRILRKSETYIPDSTELTMLVSNQTARVAMVRQDLASAVKRLARLRKLEASARKLAREYAAVR